MTQEQQHLLMSVHGNLVKLKDFSQVTQNVIAEDMANEAIDDLMRLRDMLTSEKEGEYYLSDDCSTKGEDGGDEGFNEFVKENYK